MIVIRQMQEHCLKAIAAIAIALTIATPELPIARAQKPNDKSATVHGEMVLAASQPRLDVAADSGALHPAESQGSAAVDHVYSGVPTLNRDRF